MPQRPAPLLALSLCVPLGLCIALALCAALAHPAAAQTPPSAESATKLEAQIRNWLHAIDPAAKLVARPVELTPDGDHYALRVPLTGPGSSLKPDDAAFTAKAHMVDATRWALDDQQFPSDMTINTTQTVPDAPDAKNPSPDGTHPEVVSYHIRLGQQDAHGTFDPTNTQPTRSTGTIATLDIDKTGGDLASNTHAEHVTSQTSTRPLDATHITISSEGTADNYATKTGLPTGGAVEFKAHATHLAASLSGVATDRVVPLLRATTALGRLSAAPGGDGLEMTPAERAELHTLLQTAKAALTGMTLDQSFEGVTFDIAGQTGSLVKFDVNLGGEAPQAMLSAQMGILMDGLALEALPPAVAGYLPTHFAIHPTLSNVDLAVLTKMGLDATAPEKKGVRSPTADPKAMFTHGGMNAGFDGLELDVAGAHLTGTGKFNIPQPTRITGQADFSATGLDALINKLQADPAMAQGVPVAIFLKGIAKTAGDKSVWQVTVNNSKILVNGVDLSAMAGMMK